jgi:hypothetical protein
MIAAVQVDGRIDLDKVSMLLLMAALSVTGADDGGCLADGELVMLWLILATTTPWVDDGGRGADEVGGVGGWLFARVAPVPLINPVPSLRSEVGLELGSCTLTWRQFGKYEWLDSRAQFSGNLIGA